MKRIIIILPFTFLAGCISSPTDPLEPHQIVSSPTSKWVYWNKEVPVDVTEGKIIKSKRICPERYLD